MGFRFFFVSLQPVFNTTMFRNCFLIIMLLLIKSSLGFAQTMDWGLWTSVGAEKRLSKDWEMEAVFGNYVFVDETSDVNQIRTGLIATRSFADNFNVGAGYLFIARYGQDISRYRNRYFVQPMVRYRFSRFQIDYRTRLELTFRGMRNETIGMFDHQNTRWLSRNRFRVRYTTKDGQFRPYTHFETFHRLFRGWEGSYHENRFTVGTIYRMNKYHNFDFAYRLETDVDSGGQVIHRRNYVVVAYVYVF